MTQDDSDYADRSFRELDVGTSASGDEIIAVHYEENGDQTAVKVLSVENCTVDPTRIGSCFSAGLSSEIGHIPFVAVPTFTSIPFGNTASPSLVIQAVESGNWITYNYELDSFDLEIVPNMPDERLTIGN